MDRSTGNTYSVNKEQNTPGIERRRFRPYPEYKDSGVDWLGKIPAHWVVRRLKTVASVQLSNVDKKSVEGQESVRLCNYVDVYYSDFISPDMDFMSATATPEQVRRFSLRAGDVLITKDSESWTDIAVSAVVTSDLPNVLCGYHLALVRPPSRETGRFLARAFSAIGPRDQFQIAANGITRFGLGEDAIRSSIFGMPRIQEQRAIASFLDRETAKIDALIEKKHRLIELLQEKRTALITQAVTKGLDPTVPMKDSGIEWVGEIPIHWRVRRLKLLASINDEVLSEKTDPHFELIYVDIGGVDKIEGILEREEHLFEAAPSRARRIVRDGDVIISTVRTYLRAITPIRTPEHNLIVSTGFAVIRPKSKLSNDYAAYSLRATYFVENVVANSTGVSYPAIEASKVSSFSIAVPELMEQKQIAAFLDKETAKIDEFVAGIREAIAYLKEYRMALISASVTGKIDVREPSASAQVPY